MTKDEEITALKDKVALLEAEVKRTVTVKDLLTTKQYSPERIFIDQETVFGKSVFYDYVTVVDMSGPMGEIGLRGGTIINLRATTPYYNLDNKVLFGTGVDEPLGIVNSQCTITCFNHYDTPLSIEALVSMAESALSLTTACWCVNSMYSTDLQVAMMNHKPINGPVLHVNNNVLLGQDFIIGLFSLQYYVLGKYKNEYGQGVMVDGMPILSQPVVAGDGVRQFSPFVVLRQDG